MVFGAPLLYLRGPNLVSHYAKSRETGGKIASLSFNKHKVATTFAGEFYRVFFYDNTEFC